MTGIWSRQAIRSELPAAWATFSCGSGVSFTCSSQQSSQIPKRWMSTRGVVSLATVVLAIRKWTDWKRLDQACGEVDEVQLCAGDQPVDIYLTNWCTCQIETASNFRAPFCSIWEIRNRKSGTTLRHSDQRANYFTFVVTSSELKGFFISLSPEWISLLTVP